MIALKKTLATVLMSLLAVLPARFAAADPVNPKHVAQDAKWYVHLDFAAAKKTVLYDTLLAAARQQFPVDDALAQIKAFLGVDPLTDISGVTIYNNSFEKDVAAVLIHGQIAPEPLRAALGNNPDFKETTYNNRALLSWTDNNDGKHKNGCFYAPGLVLMADHEATLKMAIDVLDGRKPAESPLVKSQTGGAFLYGSADLAAANDPKIGQLLSNTDAATASAGEVEGKVTLTLKLTAKNADTAAQIKKMIDGVMAFGELAAAREHPTASELIRQVKVNIDGTKITASFSHESKTLLDTLKKLDAEKKNATPKENPDKPQGL